MQNFFNEPVGVVAGMLEGLSWLEPVTLVQGEGIRIVARREWDRDAVALISGGGAGHEPAHAGFVGPGMLTAAVSGEIFASPSVEAVLAGIRQVTGPAGCLLIVKNYTGDRLNFGLAAERARGEGLAVATVTVADDVALPGAAQPRGLAGTVLVHKLAGHLAARGEPLETIRQRAQALADSLATLGLALAPCHVPGRPVEARRPELGLGIHNEPGARPVAPASAREAMALVLAPLLAHVDARSGHDAPLVALLNDLGGCSPQEMLTLTRELCSQVGAGRIVRMVRPSRLMTSLDMQGFSVTLVPATDELLAALDAPVEVSAWPGTVTPRAPATVAVPADGGAEATARPQSVVVTGALRRACEAAIEGRDAIDALDAKVGDGDAGSTFASGARAVLDRLGEGRLSTGEPAALFHELGAVLARAMGGSSGVLLSILFTAMGTSLAAGATLGAAFEAGLDRVQHHGGARAGDRTMLDALLPAAAALPGGVGAAARAARAGAEATAAMSRAGAGRSSYVPDAALRGVVDPGAEAIARIFTALAG
jgi:dihydroxyacetone kinase